LGGEVLYFGEPCFDYCAVLTRELGALGGDFLPEVRYCPLAAFEIFYFIPVSGSGMPSSLVLAEAINFNKNSDLEL